VKIHTVFAKCLPEEAVLLMKRKRRVRREAISRKIYIGRAGTLKVTSSYSMEKGIQVQDNIRSIARQRVQTLFSLAKETLDEDPVLAQQYVDTARRIAMAAKIRLPRQYRRQICRHCKRFILPSVNCRVRIKQLREPHIVTTCFNCGKQTRIPLSKKDGS
jgi:ribonuclease P protein subunit RPR2